MSCLWALSSSFCVGRWIQTTRRKPSALVPKKLMCLGTRRPGKTLSADQQSHLLSKNCMRMIAVPAGWRCCLTLTRGTLKATGSMVDLVSISATAISTLCTLHSVLGRKAKPWTKDKWQRIEGDILDIREEEISSVPCVVQESWSCYSPGSMDLQQLPHKWELWYHPKNTLSYLDGHCL